MSDKTKMMLGGAVVAYFLWRAYRYDPIFHKFNEWDAARKNAALKKTV